MSAHFPGAGKNRQRLRRAAQEAFWILATCALFGALFLALAIPPTVAALIFGSEA